jgi:ligand-binding SRPBCC domain-containing protein
MKTSLQQLTYPSQLEEVQLSGPFLKWTQKRRLRIASGGTWLIDEIEYEIPWGVTGRILNRLLVRGKLDRWFDYRQASTIELLLPDVAQAAHAPSTRSSRARLRRATRQGEPE